MPKAEKIPPILVVSGDDGFQRRRFLDDVVSTKRAEGWRVETVAGDDRDTLRDALTGNPFMPEMVLVVVENPQKVDIDTLTRHQHVMDPAAVLLLHIDGKPDGRTKFGKFVNKDLKAHHRVFEAPPDWKAPEVASQFLHEELKAHGLTIESRLVPAMIERVGSDLGMVRYEVLKLAMLAQVEGITHIGRDQIKQAMAAIAEAEITPISQALTMKSAPRLYRALDHVRQTSKGDPTMRVCRFLGATIQRWLMAAYLDALPPKEAAKEIGQHPWAFEKMTLPGARAWGRRGTVDLARVIARAERALLSGAIDPWKVLSAGLLSACRKI